MAIRGAIRAHGAKTIILETAAPRNSEHTNAAYDAQYRRAASDLGAMLAPVDVAWSAAESQGIDLRHDDVHPNAGGSYLIACVLYDVITGERASGRLPQFERDAWDAVHGR